MAGVMVGVMAGIGQMRPPKYVRVKFGAYYFQRDYPTNLAEND